MCRCGCDYVLLAGEVLSEAGTLTSVSPGPDPVCSALCLAEETRLKVMSGNSRGHGVVTFGSDLSLTSEPCVQDWGLIVKSSA